MKELQEKLNDNNNKKNMNKPIAPLPPPISSIPSVSQPEPLLPSAPQPVIVEKVEVIEDGDDLNAPRFSFQLPAPPTVDEMEEINRNSMSTKKEETAKVIVNGLNKEEVEQVVKVESEQNKIASIMVQHNYDNIDYTGGANSFNINKEVDVDKLSSEIFEDVCEEVIKCDHAAPSVPDVILQVISEYLAESQSSQDDANSDSSTMVGFTPGGVSTTTATVAIAVVEVSNFKKEEPLIEAKVHSNGANYDKEEERQKPVPITTTVVVTSPEKKNESKPTVVPVVQQPKAAITSPSVDVTQAKLNRNRTRKTITKTFVVEGQTITQTIKKTVNLEEEERLRRLQEERKRDLIEHRRNLNEDKRKITDLTRKQENEKEALEQDFREQREKLLREFDIKLAQISQFRKSEIERCEEAQAIELRSAIKKLKSEQEKLLKTFREHLKDELKLFKKEVDTNQQLNKELREMYKKQKEKELLKREEEFIQRQLDDLSVEEKRIMKLHKQQLANLEASSLIEKQNLIRTREAALWELEQRQMDNKFNVIRKHVRDFFYLQRHLMLTKQEKDIEHLRQINTKLEEDLIRRQNEEKRLFTKSLRQEQRSRREMYRRSLYIIPANFNASQNSEKLSADEEKRKIKDFEEKEKERFESEIQRLTIRHLKQIEEHRITAENLIKDLEEEQVSCDFDTKNKHY